MYDQNGEIAQLREAFVALLYVQTRNHATKKQTKIPPRLNADQQIELLREIVGINRRRRFAFDCFVFGAAVGAACATLLIILFLNC